MPTHLTNVGRGDADQLERDWGVKVAVQMLHEGLVSPMGFLVCARRPLEQMTRAGPLRRTYGSAGELVQRNGRGGTAMARSARCDEVLRLIGEALNHDVAPCHRVSSMADGPRVSRANKRPDEHQRVEQ